MTPTSDRAAGRLTPLAWDSAHFGFPVALLTGDEADVRAALAAAHAEGIRLVYWFAPPERAVSEQLLTDFAGRLVDRKATFGAAPVPAPRTQRATVPVHEYPAGPASPELLALGVSAGVVSRFRIDDRISSEKARALYEIWTDRSARRQMADTVLVAGERDSDLLGMVTVAVKDGAGSIGLIAVAEAARGRGVGAALMDAAHRWMAGRGLTAATVVTQLDNVAACRLYRATGYDLHDLRHCYHFWPLAPAA
jgi:dTDP-4-amino-4,6-dideoxy-D-galactose acyltransferase